MEKKHTDSAVIALDPVLLWPSGAPGAAGSGPEDCPRLTPFLPKTRKPVGAVVVCPGGGYHVRAAHEREPIARWVAGGGLAGFLLDYRVAPYRHPVPLSDAQRAIRLVRSRAKEWNVLPDKIAILGFSAGGHLAVSAATVFDAGKPDAADSIDRQSCRPDALIACYPVVTFGEFRHDGSMRNLLGQEVDERLRQYLSLENRVTAQTPPTFLWHTGDDEGVPVENSLLLAAALRRCRVPVALHVFPHGQHGLGLAGDHPTARAWTGLCAEWLAEIGFRAGARDAKRIIGE